LADPLFGLAVAREPSGMNCKKCSAAGKPTAAGDLDQRSKP
jgi:hypothetical protein